MRSLYGMMLSNLQNRLIEKGNIMVKKILATCVISLLFLAQSIAAELSYSNFDIVHVDNDGQEGWGFTISEEVNDNVYINVDYSENSGNVTFDTQTFNFGIGYHSPIDQKTDLFVNAQYIDFSADQVSSNLEGNDYGYHLSSGVRSMASNTLELNAALSYYHLDIDISKSFTFGAVIHFSDSIALLAKYAISIDRERDFDLLFGFRFSL